jgi:hypothetical protein
MGSPYLNSNEPIILASQDVVVNTVPFEAILTDRRLMLVDSRNNTIQTNDIPLEALQRAEAGENAAGDPLLTLSLSAASGELLPLVLTFSQKIQKKRKQERDEWVKKIKDLISSERTTAARTGVSPPDHVAGTEEVVSTPPPLPAGVRARPDAAPVLRQPISPETAPPEPRPAQEPVPAAAAEPVPSVPEPLAKPLRPAAPPGRMRGIAVAVIIIVILAAIGGAYIYSQSQAAQQKGPAAPAPTPPLPTAATPAPTPTSTEIPTPEATPVPSQAPQVVIPQSGVWVRVEYAGSFTGWVGIPGGQPRTVTATGTWLYQVPTVNGPVVGLMRKQDGSGDLLTVEVYNNGTLVKRVTTKVPNGAIDINAELRK